MKNLLHLSIVLLLATLLPEFASAWTAPRERLTYNIMYKWGLINKKAGKVALATSGVGSPAFKSTPTAASAPWADHIYHVRDTLLGTIDTSTLMPSRYERIAHEGGRFSHDILDYSRSGNTTTAKARVWRKKKKEPMDYDERTHQAEGPTLDMLSSFYFMRSIDYAKMKAGESVRLNIFSGKKKEFLTIHYRGLTDVKLDKERFPAYHITFTFTQEGGKVSSDAMDAWISTGPARIPLLLEGKLPVGKVRALYSGNTSDIQ